MGTSSQILVSWTEQEAESEMLELKESRHVGPDRPCFMYEKPKLNSNITPITCIQFCFFKTGQKIMLITSCDL